MPQSKFLLALFTLILVLPDARGQDPALRDQAGKALRQATEFYRNKVAAEGGYLWRYSEELSRREGEKKATATQIWIQPPGTPSVGMAFLAAHQATGDPYYLESAKAAGMALVKGQLHSGGWDYFIDFDPKERKKYAYRVEAGSEKAKGMTTLDDNNTQEALRFLMRLDRTLSFKDSQIHEATRFALDSLLRAQYPNGAWPQRYERFPDPEKHPIKKASYPESWSRTFPKIDYRGFYTFNDNSIADVVDVMLEARAIYNEPKYQAAAEKAGRFMLLAQMPEPQPAWAQQYDLDMHPAWARQFEPPAVTGGESFGVMKCLLQIYRATGDKKYLEPIPRALDYLRRSTLSDGSLARFYELKTNKPLYFTKDYQLTYKDDDLPTHYGFKISNRVDRIAKEYDQVKSQDPARLKKPATRKPPMLTDKLIAETKAVLASLDNKGRWVEDGKLRYHGPDDPTSKIIQSATFSKNIATLSQYLEAAKR